MKEKHLKSNTWYFKFTNFIWNIDCSNYVNFCPLFWLTLFTVVFSPILLIFKLISKPFKRIEKYRIEVSRKKFDKRSKLVEDLSVEYLKLANSDWEAFCQLQYKYYASDSNIGIALYYAKMELTYQQKEALHVYISERREMDSRKKINKFIPLMKKAVQYLFIGVVVVWSIFVIYRLCMHFDSLLAAVAGLTIMVIFAAIVIGVIYLLGKFFTFFGNIYKDYCPEVIWEDKNSTEES
jgi:hypothetical protein